MITGPARREDLRHNPLNEVTAAVQRLTDRHGRTAVRKVLRPPSAQWQAAHWAGSTDPRHWNYWRREAEVYRCDVLAADLARAGLDLPAARVHEPPDGGDIVLWLEDVAGTPGTAFCLDDHTALATALGRWQAQGPLEQPWASRGFLRSYSCGKPAPWHLVEDDEAWRQPLVADLWPTGLRNGWRRLLAHRGQLLDVLERLPRTRCHLDLWVANQIRRPDGTPVLLDWAFCGDGAIGEDLGNHVPDAVFDLFWAAERLPELDDACRRAYLSGLRQAGWGGDERDVRLGMTASAVKYAWLLPLLLLQAADTEHHAYGEQVDVEHLYRQRGLALRHLTGWVDEALCLLP